MLLPPLPAPPPGGPFWAQNRGGNVQKCQNDEYKTQRHDVRLSSMRYYLGFLREINHSSEQIYLHLTQTPLRGFLAQDWIKIVKK